MNGWLKHNLQHTSPSQVNMWADAPCAWIASYLFKKKLPFSAAAQVGVLVEKVVADVLMGADYEAALKSAQGDFNRRNALNTNQTDLARVEHIDVMAQLALEELKQYGEPEFEVDIVQGRKQREIALVCKGADWEIPVKGFIDFYYPKHGLVIDLKTTQRMPSVMSDAHKRQAAIYRHSMGNAAVKFLYVTPRKAAWHEVEDQAETLAQVKAILTRQEAFLRLGDKELLRSVVPLNLESFYWMGAADIRKEIYGI